MATATVAAAAAAVDASASGVVMVPWLGIAEETFLQWAGYIMIASGVLTFVASQTVRAPYGRYSHEAGSLYGPPVPARLAWMLQECPSVFVPLICMFFGSEASLGGPVNRLLVGLFMAHYIQRSFVFPFLIRGGKPTPAVLVLMAFVFCLGNGYMQGRYHTRYAVYPDDWVYDPRFIVGIVLFFAGMFINIQADSILRNLRKPGETAYKIPRGGMFEYVSGANFFGEILEWTGFALASWSLVAFAFAFFTFSNTGPRGVNHHKWYQKKFSDDYPKTRKGVIPFIW